MRGGGGNCRPRRVGYAQHLTERVVGVLRHQGPRVAPAACVAAVKSRYVPLQVFGEIVVRPACLRRVLQPKSYRATTLVVQVPQSQAHAARGGKAPLPYRQTVYDVVLRIAPVRVRLLRPQAVHVVLVAGLLPPYRQAVQLPPVPPGQGVPLAIVVAQGIPRRVVGDALPVKPRQQVLPVRVPVGVAVALQVLGRRSVLRLPRRQVPRSVL